MNTDFLKTLTLVVTILYIVSPVDACEGPIDDIIVAVLGIAARKRLLVSRKKEVPTSH